MTRILPVVSLAMLVAAACAGAAAPPKASLPAAQASPSSSAEATPTASPTVTTASAPTPTAAASLVPTAPPRPAPTPVPPTAPPATPATAPATAPPPPVTSAPAATPGGTASVTVQGFQFMPASLEVTVGTTVTWTNRDAVTHTTTSGRPGAVDGRWNGELAPNGGTFSFTFTQPGAYAYFCAFHNAMTGTIVVR